MPIKTFVALANLLARPGFEAGVDVSWTTVSNDGEKHDIFDGEFLRELNTMANDLVKEMARVHLILALWFKSSHQETFPRGDYPRLLQPTSRGSIQT